MSLRQKHPPATILLSTLNELFLNQLVQKFLNGSNTDACNLFHICQSKRCLSTHGIQYLCIIRSAESYSFTIIPPYILILFTHKEHIIIYLCSHKFIKKLQERLDILDISMSPIVRHWPHLYISLMESLQILALFTAANHNHGIIMARKNEIHH